MHQRNQYYYLIISLMFFSTLLYMQNMFANNEFTDQTVINVYSDKPLFEINLKSNPSTGYKWYLDNLNQQLITSVKQQYKASKPQKNKPLIGASGIETWTFKVNKIAFNVPRTTTISFKYMRPWENDKTQESTNNVTEIKIIINPGSTPKTKPEPKTDKNISALHINKFNS
jgi:predicted secreted protein